MIATSAISESRIVGLIERYKQFFSDNAFESWNESEKVYTAFFKRFVDERAKAMEAEMLVASGYNLFSLLKLDFKEVILHTPILANLLDPRGSHGQGLLFYRYFIDMCLGEDKQHFSKVSAYDLMVTSEKRRGGEQIDILVYCCNPKNRFALIIENKIMAIDQEKQLYRYYRYANNALGLAPDQICVVYLKPEIDERGIDGLEEIEKDELNKVLVRIGYGTHIVPFLQNAINHPIKSEKVKQTIVQYLLTLKSF